MSLKLAERIVENHSTLLNCIVRDKIDACLEYKKEFFLTSLIEARYLQFFGDEIYVSEKENLTTLEDFITLFYFNHVEYEHQSDLYLLEFEAS